MTILAGRYDITVNQGSSFLLPVTVKKLDGTAFDLTDYAGGRGQIRKYHRSVDIVVSFTVALLNPKTSGQLTVALTAAQTALIPAGEIATDDRSTYLYDIEIYKTGDSSVLRILEGNAFISPEVTRT
jgi:hypothetical protein